MNRDPLVIEAEDTIDRVSERIANDHPDAVDDGFIVVEDGRYLGIGTVLALLNSSVQNARTQIAELEVARTVAEHANQAKSTFLANMSHELRTPLNAVLGFADLLATGTAGPVSDRQAEYLRDIQSSGQRLLDLINDLLDLSRAESGRLDLVETRVDPTCLIEEVQRMLAPRVLGADIVFATEIATDAWVTADERKLLQILMNLATNAVKFTPSGGSVTMGAELQDDGGMLLWVRDTGVGIPSEELETVMTPFGRGREAMARQIEGSGIGLALTRVLVELHGGHLFLESAPKQGTTACAVLPAERTLQTKNEDQEQQQLSAGG
nr:ATP-binding protein [Rhodovibrio salinarum]